MKTIKTHPVTIPVNARHIVPLALIPLLRGRFELADAVIPAIALGLSAWSWHSTRLSLKDGGLKLCRGLFTKRIYDIPLISIRAVSCGSRLAQRILRVTGVSISTFGNNPGGLYGGDFTLLLGDNDAKALRHAVLGEDGLPSGIYRPTPWKVMALSLLTSNSFGGILYMSTFIAQSGKILGKEFSGAISETFRQASALLAVYLPPAAAGVAVLVFAGWAVGFLRLFLYYFGFAFRREGDILSVSGGLLSRHGRRSDLADLSFADMRQSLLTKLLRLYSLYLGSATFNRRGRDADCVILTERLPGFERNRESLLPEFSPAKSTLKPGVKAAPRYLALPMLLLASVPAVYRGLRSFGLELFPAFAAVMSALLALWLLLVNIADLFSSGAAFDGKNYTLRYSAGFTLHTVVIPKENAVMLELRRGPLRRLGARCDLVLHTRSKRRAVHACRGLRLDEAMDFLKLQ